ncbi:MAG TPA: hypothetical protein VFA56_06175 [Gaiellaceae bacterium]|nr:hypothetical protein [Gaiellaceae bacterium]
MRSVLALAATALGAAALAATAAAAPTTTLTINHVVRGCHVWAVGSGRGLASQTIHVKAGTAFVVRNNDVMPHTLVQLGGPKIALATPKMGHSGATARFALTAPGVYTFRTKAGEDYPGMTMKTVGPDNVLRLKVVVS